MKKWQENLLVLAGVATILMFIILVYDRDREEPNDHVKPPLAVSPEKTPLIDSENQSFWIGLNPKIDVSFFEGDWCGIQNSWGKRISRLNDKLYMQSFIYRGKNNISEFRGQKEVMRLRVDEGRIYNGAGNYDFNEIWFPSNKNTIQIGKTGHYRSCNRCRDAVGTEIQQFGYAICDPQ